MPGPTTLRESLPTGADPAAVNGYLAELCAECERLYHLWIHGSDDRDLRPSLPRRKSVGAAALDEWGRLLGCTRRLPSDLRRWQADETTARLLQRLATHPADAVRLPAALALASLSYVPPLAALEAIRAARLHVAPPAWWRVPSVGYRALRWEELCVRLAEAVHGEIHAGLRNETTCVDGLVPDILAGEVRRSARGRVEWAEVVIDAKSGALPHAHSYCHLCGRLEYWHARTMGEWVTRGAPGGCEVIYRDARALVEMAPPALAEEIAEFCTDETGGGLYLRFLEDRALTRMDAAELAPTLEAPRR